MNYYPTIMIKNKVEFFITEQANPNFDWKKEYANLLQLVSQNNDLQDIHDAVMADINSGYSMPFELMHTIYEKYVELSGRTSEALKYFANYLYAFGPDYDKKADELMAEAAK